MVLVEGEQRHDDARCAVAALTSIGLDHCLLHRVQGTVRAEVLNGDHLFSMKHGKKYETGIDGVVAEARAMHLTEHNRACTAVALRATFFDAFVGREPAQIIQQCGGRRNSARLGEVMADDPPVEHEGD